MGRYLTPEEIKDFYKSKGWAIDPSSEVDVELARFAVDNFLASQMGEKSPCEGCEVMERYPRCPDSQIEHPDCALWARWHGYALGLQERDKLAWEIVWFLKDIDKESERDLRTPAQAVEEMLTSKGIREMEDKV